VAVQGSLFRPTQQYWVKVEGARLAGYRSITIAGARDPVMIDNIDPILAEVGERVAALLESQGAGAQVYFHVYGQDGVMGPREPLRKQSAHELGIVIEAVAETPERADTLCSLTRSTLMHYGYPGRIATAGNLAFPFSPSDLRAGAVYDFSIYHLLQVDPLSLFPVGIEEVGP